MRLRSSLVMFALLSVGLAGCRADGDRPGLVVLPGMVESVPYDPYDPHPVVGQTLRHPPEGTVPFGAQAFLYEAGTAEAKRAGGELENPLEADDANLARGRAVYQTYCHICHGTKGEGDGPIIGRFPNPPSLLAPRAKELPDGTLVHVMTYGQGIMAPYSLQVPLDDRWRVVLHIRSLQADKETP